MFKKLINNIKDNKIFDKAYLQDIDTSEFSDMRDEEEFDDEWMRVFEYFDNVLLEEKYLPEINKVRECAYLKVYEYTNDCDMAAFVSDDFELMCKAYILGYNDKWLNQLVNIYTMKQVPAGKLNVVCKDIKKKNEKMLF